MKVVVTPTKLKGKIKAIASKSYAHRIIMAAALCDEPTVIYCNGISDDIMATITAVTDLGAKAIVDKNRILISPIIKTQREVTVHVNESGTTARMILPIACALYSKGTIIGKGSLLKRPFGALCDCISEHGVVFSDNHLPISFDGKMQSGEYKISASESSQYISGLLFSLPLLKGHSKLTLTSPLASSGYVDMTREVLKIFGACGEYETEGYERFISPGEITVEGDASNSAFWLCAGIDVKGLNPNSLQKDILFDKIKDNDIIDASDIPDLVPILSVYACKKTGTTKFINTERLKIKESDRVESVCNMIRALGGKIEASDNEITVYGTGTLVGGTVDSYNDHRIVMSAAIASTICTEKVVIENAEAVNKSYPKFFDDFKKLGGIIDVE